MKTYHKPALTFDQQVDLLESRGLIISDKERTKRHLKNVSYYRISAYMIPFRQIDANGNITDDFKQGIYWDDVYCLYKFDRKLRLLVFDAIERIEIALRTQLIYQLSHKYGSHWQDNRQIFKIIYTKSHDKINVYKEISAHITEQLTANKKVPYIEHYLKTYDNPSTPPSWMSVELLYFNELSKICQGLKRKSDVMDIANYFQIHNEVVFCSWLHSINYIRNICAHHARLWNITLAIQPIKYKKPKSSLVWLGKEDMPMVRNSKLYYFLCIILYLLQTVNPKSKFKAHFIDLLKEYPVVNVSHMGFPINWKEQPLWRTK